MDTTTSNTTLNTNDATATATMNDQAAPSLSASPPHAPSSSAHILTELGLENLPVEEKSTILEQLTSLVQKRVMVRILETLTDDQKDEMGQLLEKNGGDSSTLTDWLSEKMPNIGAIVQEETEKVKTELLSSNALQGI